MDVKSSKSLQYLRSLTGLGIRLDLAPLMRALERLGSPERKYRTVLIAGTNGKGSIAAMVSSILTQAGWRTGLYTSPHLTDYRERIRVDGKMIPRCDLRNLIEKARLHMGETLTYFEFSTLLAFLYFEQCKVDVAVLEVGMGGRFDATNVVDPDVSVISNISLEHRDFLGGRLRDIAREKGGIIREGGICLTAARQRDVVGVLEGICSVRGASLYRLGREIRVRRKSPGIFSYRGIRRHFDRLETPLPGRHQLENASLALGVIEIVDSRGLKISDQAVVNGMKATRWAGRLEVLRESPMLVVDGAHNPAGVSALCRTLSEDFRYRRLIFIFGVLRDKDYVNMLGKIARDTDLLILTRPGRTERALPPEALEETARKCATNVIVAENPEKALQTALNVAGRSDLICAGGSLYLVGEIKRAFSRRKESPEQASRS